VEHEWISENVDWIRNELKEIDLIGFLSGAVVDALDDVDRSDPGANNRKLSPQYFPKH